MKKEYYQNIPKTYANRGQHLEQVVRFNYTGEVVKADNLPAIKSSDLYYNGCGYQIKSPKATVAKGEDLVVNNISNKFIFVTNECVGYVMNKKEYLEFLKNFAYKSTTSTGKSCWRIYPQSKKMIKYLDARA